MSGPDGGSRGVEAGVICHCVLRVQHIRRDVVLERPRVARQRVELVHGHVVGLHVALQVVVPVLQAAEAVPQGGRVGVLARGAVRRGPAAEAVLALELRGQFSNVVGDVELSLDPVKPVLKGPERPARGHAFALGLDLHAELLKLLLLLVAEALVELASHPVDLRLERVEAVGGGPVRGGDAGHPLRLFELLELDLASSGVKSALRFGQVILLCVAQP